MLVINVIQKYCLIFNPIENFKLNYIFNLKSKYILNLYHETHYYIFEIFLVNWH